MFLTTQHKSMKFTAFRSFVTQHPLWMENISSFIHHSPAHWSTLTLNPSTFQVQNSNIFHPKPQPQFTPILVFQIFRFTIGNHACQVPDSRISTLQHRTDAFIQIHDEVTHDIPSTILFFLFKCHKGMQQRNTWLTPGVIDYQDGERLSKLGMYSVEFIHYGAE